MWALRQQSWTLARIALEFNVSIHTVQRGISDGRVFYMGKQHPSFGGYTKYKHAVLFKQINKPFLGIEHPRNRPLARIPKG